MDYDLDSSLDRFYERPEKKLPKSTFQSEKINIEERDLLEGYLNSFEFLEDIGFKWIRERSKPNAFKRDHEKELINKKKKS